MRGPVPPSLGVAAPASRQRGHSPAGDSGGTGAWQRGHWGVEESSFMYPVTGVSTAPGYSEGRIFATT